MDIRPNTKLKSILLEKDITQRSLAFGTNLDESRISRIIKGYEKPTSEMKDSISDYLGVEPEELFSA
jgi:transcriptional regulator with XRE-family HTH domain